MERWKNGYSKRIKEERLSEEKRREMHREESEGKMLVCEGRV